MLVISRSVCGLALLGVLLSSGNPVLAAPSFEHDVLPIFKQHCYSCHDGRKQTAGLRLDLRDKAFKGGESGEAGIVRGKAADSSLVARVASTDPDIRMPPKGPGLSPKEIQTLQDWINQGADWPDSLAGFDPAGITGRSSPFPPTGAGGFLGLVAESGGSICH